jgi:cell division protein ZapA
MAQVTIQLNGKPYVVGCEDGQEKHLTELAQLFDGHVRQVAQSVGQLPDARLFMMAGLMMADDLADARSQATRARSQIDMARSGQSGLESKAAAALDAAARRIEALAGRVGSDGG